MSDQQRVLKYDEYGHMTPTISQIRIRTLVSRSESYDTTSGNAYSRPIDPPSQSLLTFSDLLQRCSLTPPSALLPSKLWSFSSSWNVVLNPSPWTNNGFLLSSVLFKGNYSHEGSGTMAASTSFSSFIYLLLVVAFMTLYLVSHSPSNLHTRSHRRTLPGKRIKVRAVHHDKKHHDPVAFDPIVADFERRKEDLAWEKQHFEDQYKKLGEQLQKNGGISHHEEPYRGEPLKILKNDQVDPHDVDPDYEDPEEYLNDEDQFNITERLTSLFPLIDINPRDDYVTSLELLEWHLVQGKKAMLHRSDREMESHDKNHDGLVSLEEYLPHVLGAEQVAAGHNSTEFDDAGWYKQQFEVCDRDNDGLLNATEFNDFLHPDDSNNPRVRQWCRLEQIRTHDTNKDGKIGWEEFHHGLFDQLQDEQDYHHPKLAEQLEAEKLVQSKRKFAELDRNKDGYLTEDEIAPVMEKLRPGELYYAKQQSDYLLHEADENRDERLSLDEMLNHPYIFYSTAYDEDEFDPAIHDEFR
ncbi:uncharacterized protein [Physcomitrium patens]